MKFEPAKPADKESLSLSRADCMFAGAEAVEVFAAAAGEETEAAPRFKMVANSGRTMTGHPLWNNWALDLEGMAVGNQRMPALRDHDRSRIVGWTEKIERTKRGIEVAGIFSRETEAGRETLALAKEGFPWQASVYVPPSKIERVEEGQTAEANGRKFKGPGVIFRKFELCEVTVCPLGADPHTSVVAAAAANEKLEVEVEVVMSGDTSPISATETREVSPDDKEIEMELSELTIEMLKAERTDLADKLVAEGYEAGAKQSSEADHTAGYKEGWEAGEKKEKERYLGIRAKAEELKLDAAAADKLVEDGTTVEDAEKKLMAAKIDALQAAAPVSAGPAPDAEAALADLPDGKRWEAEWDRSAELQASFNNQKGAYLAYCKANAAGHVRIFGADAPKS